MWYKKCIFSYIFCFIYLFNNELCRGIISASSKRKYLDVIKKLQKQGAEAVILGCTEIGVLIKQEDVSLPVYDTTLIHAEKAALLAMEES